MGTIKNFIPTVVQPIGGTPPEITTNVENGFPAGTAKDQEATSATVMMTRLYDKDVQIKFHRLMVMGQNDKIADTYPLNHKITTIGRSRRNHVRIKDALVSVRHLTVSVSGTTCVITDLNSSNGTFINGERLVGAKVLKDGDEIMLGRTIMQFASRQAHPPARRTNISMGTLPLPLAGKKRMFMWTAALMVLIMSIPLVYMGTHIASGLYPSKGRAHIIKIEDSRPSTPGNGKTEPPPQKQVVEKQSAATVTAAPPAQPSPIRIALSDYAAGRIERSIQSLKLSAAATQVTPETLKAETLLQKVMTVHELHAQALHYQEQNELAKALACWDRILIVDMQLVGDQPSFFAIQAEEKVQELSYEHALEAFRKKNLQKARQLCQVILQLNPNHPKALTLMAKIDPKV